MGINTQAMLRASSSAEEADEGAAMPECFPFTVIPGGENRADMPVNTAFVAYAKRSAPPRRPARESLALALAETEARAGGESRSGAGGERVDEASYGVTRSPFARVSAPVAAPAAAAVVAPTVGKTEPEPVAAKVEVAKVEVAPKRRPTLREDVAAPTMEPAPELAPAPAPEPATAAGEPGAEPSAGKLKIFLRRAAAPVAPPPVAPPPDAPFLFGPVMEGTRSPLVPLPMASGEPGGAFVPPTHALTRSPFPVTAGSAGAGLAPLATGQAGRSPQGRAVAARARRSGAREVGHGRLAVVGVSVALLALAGYFFKQSPYWPFRMKPVAVAGATEAQRDARASSAESRGESVAPALPVTHSAVAALATPARPAPGVAFTGVLERLRITGVLQGEPVRAIIDGRLVQAGDLVEVAREVRLIGLDVAGRQLIFEDRTTARASVRY